VGWDPKPVFPASGEPEAGAVFLTHGHGDEPTVWTLLEYEPGDRRVAYLRVAPGSHVARIEVACAEDGAPGATSAEVTYRFTGLSAAGNDYVARFTEDHFRAWIAEWEEKIDRHLRGRS
jgi:hypothetical protein